MSIRSIEEICQVLERRLKETLKPMTHVNLMDLPDVREAAIAEYGRDIRIATNKLFDARILRNPTLFLPRFLLDGR